MAAPWIDWRLASEIEKFPRAVLQERLGYKSPDDHNQGDPLLWGDMTEVTPDLARSRGVPLPDIMIAGTPCQAFSIAGLRGGVDDARGNLTLKFVETCHAIVDARLDGKLAVLWENVPGVLSDKGNAFGCFLGGIVGADDALCPPSGGSWPSSGMVSGPRARAAWRVLDAQYFGVSQHRRRLFAVFDFGETLDPAEVLFERKGDARAHQAQSASIPADTSFFMPGARAVDRKIAETLGARDYKDPQIVACPDSVRRLSVLEYLRLQGFPDDHTAILYDGRPAKDAWQYKAIGNSMAVPCIAWITDRMKTSMEKST